jgi:hypothetical protein
VPAGVRIGMDAATVWAKMEDLCEKRNGHRGIEFMEMEIVKEN